MGENPHAREAAECLTDLTVFHAVIQIMEGGCLRARSEAAASRIIQICKAEAGKRLRDYDRAMAKVGRT